MNRKDILHVDIEKIKSIEAHLKEVCEDFLNIFPDEIKEKLKDKFYLAGGCIYSLYNDKTPHDYDFFIQDNTTKVNLLTFLLSCTTKFKHGNIAIGKLNGFNFVKTKYAITIIESDHIVNKYQIIHKYIGSPNEVVEEFDFKHNMFYYSPKDNFLGSHESVSFKYLKTNELCFNDLRCRDLCGVILRLPKFTSRGMIIKKKEIAKILIKLQGCINDENEKEIVLDYLSTQGY